jgi:O-antigen ligase
MFTKLKTALDRVVFLGLLAVAVIAILPYGTVDAWWEAAFESWVFGLTILWVLESLLREDWQIRRVAILVPLGIITAYAFVQAVQWPLLWLATGDQTVHRTLSIDRYQTLLTARKLLASTLFLGLLLVHTSTPKRFRWLVRTVIGVGFLSALFGIFRQFLQSPNSTNGFVLPFLYPGIGYGQFISANVFSYLMEMTFGLLMGLVLGAGVVRSRLPMYLVIATTTWTALVLCNSRGGIISLTIQAMFLLFVSMNWYLARRLSRTRGPHKWLTIMRSSLVRMFFTLVLIGTLVTGVFWMGGERLASKQQQADAAQAVIDGTTRPEIWRASWALIKHNIWTGVGFGTYFLGITQYQTGSGRIKLEAAHNDYLDLAASGGLVAVALAAWFVGLLLWRAKSRLNSQDPYRRAAGLGALAGLMGVAVHSLVDFGIQITGISVILACLIVIVVADERVDVNRDSARTTDLQDDMP